MLRGHGGNRIELARQLDCSPGEIIDRIQCPPAREELDRPDELASVPAARKVLGEEEMSALESTEPTRASV